MLNKVVNFLLYSSLLLVACNLYSQVYEVHPPNYIQSIQCKGNTKLSQPRIISLGSNVTLSFDDLHADEKDYYYRINHYNFDWTPSNISKNEYLDGFDESRIKNYANSINTLQSYSHYELRITNNDLNRFKISGNYILEIFDCDYNIIYST